MGYELGVSLSKEQQEKATGLAYKDYNYNQAESYSDNAIVPYTEINTKALTGKNKHYYKT